MRLTYDGDVSLVVDATEFVLSHTEVSAGVFKLSRHNPACMIVLNNIHVLHLTFNKQIDRN